LAEQFLQCLIIFGVARCNGPGFLLNGAEQGYGRRGATVSAEHGIDKTFPIKGKI